MKNKIESYGEIKEFNLFCFDYLIKDKKNKRKYLAKVVKDANTITKKSYKHLVVFSKLTNSIPLVIAKKYNTKNDLKDNVYYFFKNVPMMNESTFLKLLEEKDLEYIHKHKPKRSEKPFFNEVESRLEEEFKNLRKELLVKIKEINDDIIKLERIVNYYINKESVFIKNISRFEKNKEQKIINFSKENEKKIVFVSYKHKKEIIDEDFLVLPYKKIKDNFIIKIKEILEELY